MNTIITGGAGFIGSALVRFVCGQLGWNVLNIDKLTYASKLSSLRDVAGLPNYHFLQTDINNTPLICNAVAEFEPDSIIHLAAESHVDRSLNAPADFIQTNLVGTYSLLEAARFYYDGLSGDKKENFRFHHVSTDEVYGSLGASGFFTEESPYQPRNPYSASKAGSDHLVQAWFHSFGFPTIISHSTNNFGPYQHSEKLIPQMILNALEEKLLPIYGDGKNIRDWLYVDDHAKAIVLIATKGTPGRTYGISGRNERSNLELVETLCRMLDEKRPRTLGGSYRDLITLVADRPGHDKRYAIDPSRLETELGWKAEETFENALSKTLDGYLR